MKHPQMKHLQEIQQLKRLRDNALDMMHKHRPMSSAYMLAERKWLKINEAIINKYITADDSEKMASFMGRRLEVIRRQIVDIQKAINNANAKEMTIVSKRLVDKLQQLYKMESQMVIEFEIAS